MISGLILRNSYSHCISLEHSSPKPRNFSKINSILFEQHVVNTPSFDFSEDPTQFPPLPHVPVCFSDCTILKLIHNYASRMKKESDSIYPHFPIFYFPITVPLTVGIWLSVVRRAVLTQNAC